MNGKPQFVRSRIGGKLTGTVWDYDFVPRPSDELLAGFNIGIFYKDGSRVPEMELYMIRQITTSDGPILNVRYNDVSRRPLPADAETYLEMGPPA